MKKKVSSDPKEKTQNLIRRSLYKVVFALILIVLGMMYYEKREENEKREAEGLFPIPVKKSSDFADKTTFVYVNNSKQDVLFQTAYGNMSVPAGETRRGALHQVKGDFEIVARDAKTGKELNKLIYRFKQLGDTKLIIKKLQFEINSLNELGMMDAALGNP